MKAPSVKLIRQKTMRKGMRVTVWQLRWPTKNGQFRTETIGVIGEMTEGEAGEMRRRKIVDLDTGKALRDRTNLTLRHFLELDRDSIRSDVQSSTIKVHEIVSEHAIQAIGGDTPIERIDWTHVADLKRWLSAEHVVNGRKKPPASRATINRTIATLKAAWNRASKRGVLVSNPFADEKLGRVQSKQKRIFSAEEVQAMIDASGSIWWAAFIRLAFTTGLRLGEIVNLTWDDIDGDGQQVIVSAKRAGRFHVGDDTYPILEWSAKSHHERRVPIGDDVVEMLNRLCVRSGGSRYVFLSLERLAVLDRKAQDGNLPQPAHWINNLGRDFTVIQDHARALLAERRKVDVEKVEWTRATIHDLRRTFGTHTARRVSMHELARLMGHSQITTTQQFYLEVGDDLADRVRRAFVNVA